MAEELGPAVGSVEVGDFVVGLFVIFDNTCEICCSGHQSGCVQGQLARQTIGIRAETARIPTAPLSPPQRSPPRS
ncbi:hypothetical protein ACIRL2_42420 [Embleya sp. NPDC127516]|uniref:hypothetical protein n=1 Tax=Embleya sp. NPDC127516 TaxID=3363990 RepID=UPI0038233A91